jgi:aminoglycoside phosphotransferase family enzyme
MKIKISFDGQSKGVVASVQLEADTNNSSESDKLLEEAKRLYNLADSYATQKTISKMR